MLQICFILLGRNNLRWAGICRYRDMQKAGSGGHRINEVSKTEKKNLTEKRTKKFKAVEAEKI